MHGIYLYLSSVPTCVTFQIPSLVRFRASLVSVMPFTLQVFRAHMHVLHSFPPVILIPYDPWVSVIHEPSAWLVQWGTAGRNKCLQSHLFSCLVLVGLTSVYQRTCSWNHFSYSLSVCLSNMNPFLPIRRYI